MVGTKAGAVKARETMLKKYGENGYRKFFSEIGRRGGLVKTPTGGFASNKIGADGLTGRERSHIAGKKGGLISRRTGVKNYEGKQANRDIDEIERQLEEDGGRD